MTSRGEGPEIGEVAITQWDSLRISLVVISMGGLARADTGWVDGVAGNPPCLPDIPTYLL